MKNPKYFRAFARYSVLSVLGTLGVSCYILADTFFVAQGLGTDGLTALNLAIPVYNLIHGSGLMLGMGGATLFSVVLGKQERNANRIYTQTLCLAAVFSAFFFLLGLYRLQDSWAQMHRCSTEQQPICAGYCCSHPRSF